MVAHSIGRPLASLRGRSRKMSVMFFKRVFPPATTKLFEPLEKPIQPEMLQMMYGTLIVWFTNISRRNDSITFHAVLYTQNARQGAFFPAPAFTRESAPLSPFCHSTARFNYAEPARVASIIHSRERHSLLESFTWKQSFHPIALSDQTISHVDC